jgi:hypothetical protein
MENWFITLFCGLIAYGLTFYAFFKAMKYMTKAEGFIEKTLKMPWLAEASWWLMPWVFLWIVIETVHKFVAFMNWVTG